MTTATQVAPLYQKVVEDVINNVKEAFLDEGVDEQVLQELKQLWEKKLSNTKALEHSALPRTVGLQRSGQSGGHSGQSGQTKTQQLQVLRDQACNTQQQLQQHQPVVIPQTALLAAAASAAPQPQQTIPVSITPNQPELALAPSQTTITLPVSLFQQQLAAFSQGNITLQATVNGQLIAVQNINGQPTAITIPQHALVAQSTLQPQTTESQPGVIPQVDGTGDGSSSSEEDDFDDNDDDNDDEQNEEEADQGEEEVPLNTDDDVSEEDPTELFDTENVVVCQYDKINRNKNKWKFNLKDGIMSLNGKDFVFQRALGDAEW